MSEIRIGVLGLGFMGATHIRAYGKAREDGLPCRLVGVCDRDEQRLTGRATEAGNIDTGGGELLFDPKDVGCFTDYDEMLARGDVDLVSVCTHTETHVPMAIRALEAGKHVLVEKPVATSLAEVERLASAAEKAGKVCMPGHCMRFWPGWDMIREWIRDGRYGAVRSAVFRRAGAAPGWSSFYADAARSGGALFDLHVHDTDFVNSCFGVPDEVVSAGHTNHVTTVYRYESGPAHVVAEGAWDVSPTYPFRIFCEIAFERATAVWDLWREPLFEVFGADGAEAIELSEATGYEQEIARLIAALRDGEPSPISMRDAVLTTRILEAERRSLAGGGAVVKV
jgi:predicted dehydrogenase